MNEPYNFDPSEMKVNTSREFAVVVNGGAIFPVKRYPCSKVSELPPDVFCTT
jgi:hypothetical protein